MFRRCLATRLNFVISFLFWRFSLIMEVQKISPPIHGFLQVKLDQVIVDYLWKIIDISKNKNINNKSRLIGNISQSILLEDIDSFFFESVCVPLVKFYRDDSCFGRDPICPNTIDTGKAGLKLDSMWVNYQFKTEFNPYHDHSGAYSFAIWMKIPYSWEEQKQLSQFNDIEESNRKVGNFEIEYTDSLGEIRNYAYNLSPDFEGIMLFFPARLRHCVYPFYETDEPRISIAGNLSYLPV